MKVVCRKCNALIDEENAVRMSVSEYKAWEHKSQPSIGFYLSEANESWIYTQICQRCWFGGSED